MNKRKIPILIDIKQTNCYLINYHIVITMKKTKAGVKGVEQDGKGVS